MNRMWDHASEIPRGDLPVNDDLDTNEEDTVVTKEMLDLIVRLVEDNPNKDIEVVKHVVDEDGIACSKDEANTIFYAIGIYNDIRLIDMYEFQNGIMVTHVVNDEWVYKIDGYENL